MKKLQLLMPHYKEPFEVCKNLLDSIAIQQNINFDEIGVIIADDGGFAPLPEDKLDTYPFEIQYYIGENKGVSAARNNCLDLATADYVMFCDIDDMFYSVDALYIIMHQINTEPFEVLICHFKEEVKLPDGRIGFVSHRQNPTFVHGKVYNRKFLIDNNLRFNNSLTLHEDSYFNNLSVNIASNIKYCDEPLYVWKWNENSVCRKDKFFSITSYKPMLRSHWTLLDQFLERGKKNNAVVYFARMAFETYFHLTGPIWNQPQFKKIKKETELFFKDYYKKFSYLLDELDATAKCQLVNEARQKIAFPIGQSMDSITWQDWIKYINSL